MSATEAAGRALSSELVRSLREGDGSTLEADADVNRASRDVVAAMLAEHGRAFLGRVNLYGDDSGRPEAALWEHKEGEPVYNFGSAFVLPAFDAEIVRLVLERDAAPYEGTARDRVRVDAIFARVAALGGQILVWT